MAKYRIETNQGTFEIEADREPTAQDVEARLSAQQAPENKMAQSTAAEPWKPYFNSKEEYDAAVARQATDNPESVGSKAKMAGQAIGSAALRVGLPAAAVALAPVTGGASLAAIGGVAGAAGEYLGAKVAGEDASAGDIAAAGIMGAIPGANMAKATTGQMLKEGVKQGIGNLASTAAQTGLNEGRLPTGAEALMSFGGGMASVPASKFMGGAGRELTDEQANMAKRAKVVELWRAEGGVVDPSLVDRPVFGLTDLAGVEGMNKAASAKNVLVTQKVIRKDLGIPGNGPITTETLDNVRQEAGKSYAEVASLSKQAASDLENLKQARFAARDAAEAYKNTGNPAARTEWHKLKDIAQNLEDLIEKHAADAGRPELVDQLRRDRVLIAKSYDVEAALNPSNGQVDANVLNAAYNGRNMTGGLQLVAEMAGNAGNNMREKSLIGSGASRIGAMFQGNAASQGTPEGLLAGLYHKAGGPARKFLLSDVVQNWAAKNPEKTLPESVRQALARFSVLSASRQMNAFMPPVQPEQAQ